MSLRPISILVAGSVALGALAAPLAASAQSYDRYGDRSYGYDCQPSRGNQTAGAVIGALAGAALGSNVAGRGAKSEGGVIGALAGAAIGAQAAKGASRNGCYDRNAYGYGNSNGYYGGSTYGYGQTSPYYGRDYSRDYGYGTSRDYPYRGYGSDREDDRDYDYRRPVSESGSLDGCRLAESPIYLPDGRTEKRYVRVCPDGNGRYRVVD